MSETATDQTHDDTDKEYVDNNDIPGQVVYPDRIVDAERAGNFVAGKVDTLYPEGTAPEGEYVGPNPMLQDRPTGDESGEETEPTENPDFDPNDPMHHT